MDLGAKEVPKLLVAMIEVNSWVLFFPLLVWNYDEMSVLFSLPLLQQQLVFLDPGLGGSETSCCGKI